VRDFIGRNHGLLGDVGLARLRVVESDAEVQESSWKGQRVQWGRILNLTGEDFEAEFADSPIKRLGLNGLKRNAQICLGNANG